MKKETMKRVTVYLLPTEYRKLKAKLALVDESVSSWFREKIRKFVEEK